MVDVMIFCSFFEQKQWLPRTTWTVDRNLFDARIIFPGLKPFNFKTLAFFWEKKSTKSILIVWDGLKLFVLNWALSALLL